MATERQPVSDLPVPPGEFLAETLGAVNLTQAELARRMGRPAQAVNEIVRGAKEITAETAIQLERVLGVPAHIWLGLETEYQHTRARLEDRRRLEGEAELADRFPCADMTRWGWLPRTRRNDKASRVAALLDYFGVASLQVVAEAAGPAYRLSRTRETRPEALAAWLRRGEIEAQRIAVKPFDAARLRGFLPELRRLTTTGPQEFEARIKSELAECGVALVLVPHLRKTHAHGATRWLTPANALIQLSLRGKWADIFWFTLFHEIGHILLHGRRAVFIERDDRRTEQDAAESEADAFARDHLIPREDYDAFVRGVQHPTRAAVNSFARRVGVAPGVVVGRLQHEGRLFRSAFNDLRSRYDWVVASAAQRETV
jgi:HTH-type transcriptional regulator/antitoxin HigA